MKNKHKHIIAIVPVVQNYTNSDGIYKQNVSLNLIVERYFMRKSSKDYIGIANFMCKYCPECGKKLI